MIGIDGSAVFLKILDSSPKIRRIFVDASDLRRVLRLECEYNASLLRCVDLQSEAINHRAPGFLLIAEKLEHGALAAAVGLGEKSDKFLAQLKIVEFTDSPSLSEEPELTVTRKKVSVQRKLEYLLVAVKTVKSAAEILGSTEGVNTLGLKNIRIRRRLIWLEETYRSLVLTLEQDTE